MLEKTTIPQKKVAIGMTQERHANSFCNERRLPFKAIEDLIDER